MGMRCARCPKCKKRRRYENLSTRAHKAGSIPLCEVCKESERLEKEKGNMDDVELMGKNAGLQDMTGSLFGDLPEGRGCMAVMGKAGDSKYIWDPNNTVECDIARETFDAYRSRGYLAFKVVGKDGEEGDQMMEFDPLAGRIIFVPPMAGG